MPKEFSPRRLDIPAFAEAGASLSGQDPLTQFERVLAETEGRSQGQAVAWTAQGEQRNAQHLKPQNWLHLRAQTTLSLTCQRCLTPVDVAVQVDRSFRFVADEAAALAEDDDCEEDLLVLTRQFDLPALVEDEILMDLPLVPQHETCPEPVTLSVQDPDFEEESSRPHPFAALARLKGGSGPT